MDLRERTDDSVARHPWETVRAAFFARVLTGLGATRRPIDVLDVGAGDAFSAHTLLTGLHDGSTITCVDSGYTEEQIARLRESSAPQVGFSSSLPEREFEAIVMLDVLEHIDDDREFLREQIVRRLARRGVLLVSVPAHQALYTQHDVALGHYRRYSARELTATIEDAGLAITRSGSLFGSLIVPRAIQTTLERIRDIRSRPSVDRLSERITTGVSNWRHGPVVTGLVRGALELDARMCELASRYALPSTGLSVWALCEHRRRT